MKKINKLILENFKFFNGLQEFNFDGKNVLIYGENGSGKSSIYWALYTFFQSSLKDNENIKKYFDISHPENLVNRFAQENENSSIKVEIINIENNNLETMGISKDSFGTNQSDNTQIQEALKSSDFINYKLLSRLYDFSNSQTIDLFHLFEKELFDYLFIDNINLGEFWRELKKGLNPRPKMSDPIYKDFQNKITKFNAYFERKLPIFIQQTNKFLKNDFKENIEIDIQYKKATYNAFLPDSRTKRDKKTTPPKFTLNVKILNKNITNKEIKKPHIFLNEAKLTAISLAFRFAILNDRLSTGMKVLILDDLLISLDMSYRIEVINILEKYFNDFQLIIMTHDKGFYQLLKRKISNEWNIFELYNDNDKQCVKSKELSYISKAKKMFEEKDYEAVAHFLRKETEEILKHYLDPNLKYINKEFINLENLIKKIKQEIELDYTYKFDKLFRDRNIDNDLAKKIKNFEKDENLTQEDKNKLYQARGDLFNVFIKYNEYKNNEVKIFEELKNIKDRVLNPASHYNEAPIFKKETEDAIKLIDRLKQFLENKSSKQTITQQNLNCNNNNTLNKNNLNTAIDDFIVDIENDILNKFDTISSSEELNQILKNNILNNIEYFNSINLEKLFDELRFQKNITLFNLDTEKILIKIFRQKNWHIDEKKLWCEFVKYLDEQQIIKEPLFIQKLEEKETLKKYYGDNSHIYRIDCDFLIEIPF